jgi:hypothetical protein
MLLLAAWLSTVAESKDFFQGNVVLRYAVSTESSEIKNVIVP